MTFIILCKCFSLLTTQKSYFYISVNENFFFRQEKVSETMMKYFSSSFIRMKKVLALFSPLLTPILLGSSPPPWVFVLDTWFDTGHGQRNYKDTKTLNVVFSGV